MSTYVKSLARDSEDRICEMHTRCEQALNATVNGRCLWTGEQRSLLVKLKRALEEVILGVRHQYKDGYTTPERDFMAALR